MAVVFILNEDVLRLICGYALKSGIIMNETLSYDKLNGVFNIHSVHDLFVGLGDFNGCVIRHINGLDGAQGGNGVGERILEEFY